MNKFVVTHCNVLSAIIGIESILKTIEQANTRASCQVRRFPFYDVVKLSETECRIDMALAGFSRDDISIETQNDKLVIKGIAPKKDECTEYHYNGIRHADFQREFDLAIYMEVISAVFENGMLKINLKQNIPEHKKPKKIDITTI